MSSICFISRSVRRYSRSERSGIWPRKYSSSRMEYVELAMSFSIPAVSSMSVMSCVSCAVFEFVSIVIILVLSVACGVKTLVIFVIKLAKVTANPLIDGVIALH